MMRLMTDGADWLAALDPVSPWCRGRAPLAIRHRGAGPTAAARCWARRAQRRARQGGTVGDPLGMDMAGPGPPRYTLNEVAAAIRPGDPAHHRAARLVPKVRPTGKAQSPDD